MKQLHSTCYLLNPLLLGVQSIGGMHRFLWLPSLGFLYSNACWNLFEKTTCGVTLYISFFWYSKGTCNLSFGIIFVILLFLLLEATHCSPTWIVSQCLWNWMKLFWFLVKIVLFIFVSRISSKFLLHCNLGSTFPKFLMESMKRNQWFCLWNPFEFLRIFLCMSFGLLMTSLWYSYARLIYLLWCSYEFWKKTYELPVNFFWFSCEFILNFLWISYAFLIQFLCNFWNFIPFWKNFIPFFLKVWGFENCIRTE